MFSLTSSGGHSPWSYPIMVYSRQKNVIAKFSDMIDGKPTLSGDFSFSGPHTVAATTWKQPGALDDKVAVSVDLVNAFGKLAPSSDRRGRCLTGRSGVSILVPLRCHPPTKIPR